MALSTQHNNLDAIRKTSPLIHHLTNIVTVNDCANVTLAIGASPAMTVDLVDSLALVEAASALVINIGTVDPASVEVFVETGKKARARGIPVVFDPVAAGATLPRQQTAKKILETVRPTVVKGNGAEIKYLAGLATKQRGVDSLDSEGLAEAARILAKEFGVIVAATGVVDYVSDGTTTWAINGGCALMSRVTGTGCMTASLVASFLAVGPDHLSGAIQGILAMNHAGEKAESLLQEGEGTGHFRVRLIDALSLLTAGGLGIGERVTQVF